MNLENRGTCQVSVTKGRDGESTCGYPPYTNANSFCETHYKDFHQNSYIRLQKYPLNHDPIDDFQRDNLTHSLNQMMFAFEVMTKMQKILAPKDLRYWFEFNYVRNPLYPEAVEILNQTDWKPQSQAKTPIAEAFSELKIDPNIGF